MIHLTKLLLIYSLLFSTFSISAAEIHAIFVGDTSNDVGLYNAQKSLDQMQREVKRIAAFNDLPLNITVFEGFDTRIQTITNTLDQIKINPDDIIIFFIVTHGCRPSNKNNKWPDLIFPFDQSNVDFQEINQILTAKKPRLLLSIAEACNIFENQSDKPTISPTAPLNSGSKSPEYLSKDNAEFQFIRQGNPRLKKLYRTLFTETQGTIIISSASPGESSLGGLFVHKLLQSIFEADGDLPGPPPIWKTILKSASKQVNDEVQNYTRGEKKQTIQYELDLQTNSIKN